VFRHSIGFNGYVLAKSKLVEFDDVVKVVVCGDAGSFCDALSPGLPAYHDICALESANSMCGWADWDLCTWAAECGLYGIAPNDGSFP